MTPAPPPRKYVMVDTGAGYAVAFVSVYDELIAISEHPTPESAKAECLRLTKAQRIKAFLSASTATAQGARFARPLRYFPDDEFI